MENRKRSHVDVLSSALSPESSIALRQEVETPGQIMMNWMAKFSIVDYMQKSMAFYRMLQDEAEWVCSKINVGETIVLWDFSEKIADQIYEGMNREFRSSSVDKMPFVESLVKLWARSIWGSLASRELVAYRLFVDYLPAIVLCKLTEKKNITVDQRFDAHDSYEVLESLESIFADNAGPHLLGTVQVDSTSIPSTEALSGRDLVNQQAASVKPNCGDSRSIKISWETTLVDEILIVDNYKFMAELQQCRIEAKAYDIRSTVSRSSPVDLDMVISNIATMATQLVTYESENFLKVVESIVCIYARYIWKRVREHLHVIARDILIECLPTLVHIEICKKSITDECIEKFVKSKRKLQTRESIFGPSPSPRLLKARFQKHAH